jgi:hypothetical protein
MPPLEICHPGPGPLWPVRKYGPACTEEAYEVSKSQKYTFNFNFNILNATLKSLKIVGNMLTTLKICPQGKTLFYLVAKYSS